MGRILLASGEENLRRTRQIILEQAGYEVVSTSGLNATLQECRKNTFDLLVIGHSVPDIQKQMLVHAFRACSTAPIVCVSPTSDCPITGIDAYVEPTPESLVEAVKNILPLHN